MSTLKKRFGDFSEWQNPHNKITERGTRAVESTPRVVPRVKGATGSTPPAHQIDQFI